MFQSRIHPDVAELWLWHALEELEHKSVTYDVYEAIGNVRAERLLAFGLVTAIVGPAALVGWAGLMVQQRVWERPGDIATGMSMVFGGGLLPAPHRGEDAPVQPDRLPSRQARHHRARGGVARAAVRHRGIARGSAPPLIDARDARPYRTIRS